VLGTRLVRLVLAPGALPYALLGLVVCLVWLGVGARKLPGPAAEAPRVASAVTYRGAREPDAPLIELEQAIDSARRFAGEPGLKLEGGLQSNLGGARGLDIYYLESLGPPRGEDFFKVDARTAEVIEATFRSRLAPTDPPIGLGPIEAEQAATRYARDRFFGFADLRPVDRSSRVAENNVIHSFKWSQIAEDSGAELPVSVSVALSAGSGEVVWYLAQRDPLQVDPRPTISRTQAIQTALGSIGGQDARWDRTSPSGVRLQVLYDEDDRQQLVWSVTFRGRQEGGRANLRLLVNAHTGQVMTGPN
jgi:peptidase YpeB-like protein